MIMFMTRPVIRLINIMWVEVTHWVIHGVHSSEKAYLTSCKRCDKTQSYLSERFMNISNLRKKYTTVISIYFFVSINQSKA